MSSFHERQFAQDFQDAGGRLIHAEWDGSMWQLFDADSSEFLALWPERQLPDPFTFRPPGGAPVDTAYNDQLEALLRERLATP